MKNLKLYLFALLALSLGITACDEEDILRDLVEAEKPIPDPTTGTAGDFNFSKYVALGNSVTAGFMDGALYNSGQANSFPSLLAQQLATQGIGGGAFNQPNINSENGRSGINPSGGFFGRFELSLSLLKPVATVGEEVGLFTGDKSTLNNFGVPGMRVVDVNTPDLAANGLYARFASAPGTSTVLGDAMAASPTFFSYWLGNNDILGYASDGGFNEALITPTGDFQAALAESLGTLVSGGAKGVVLTIPPIVLTPYFRAVPYNSIPVTSEAERDQLNAGFAGLNSALDGLVAASALLPTLNVTQEEANARKVSYTVSANNPILMYDDALPDYNRAGGEFDILLEDSLITPDQREALAPFGQSRPATASDLPTLAAATQLGMTVGGNTAAIIGVTVPAADNLILSSSEVTTVVVQSAIFNGTIAAVVDQVNADSNNAITLVDVQPAFMDLAGVDAQTAISLVNPLQGAIPALAPFLAQMQADAVAAVDGIAGIEIDGVNLSPAFDPNGVMSTDGLYPNPRGNGIIANLIIDALNAANGTSIPSVNVLALRGVITTD